MPKIKELEKVEETNKMEWKYFSRVSYIAAILIVAAMSHQRAEAIEIPPTPTAHYYGDADGNVSINLSDIAQHNAYSSFRPCTYDTLQPQTSGQYWNTCDLDGNRSCNLSDIAILNSYTSFKPVTLGGDPWVLENVNLPLTGNAPNTWIPFNINLYMTNSGQPSGRPGISVIAEIDPTSPGHGQLSGRSCTPVAGTRDQLAIAGAQCALAVTITDWQAGQEGLGLTESGTYGILVWGDGDGDLKIDFHIEEWAALDVPLVSLSQTVSFTPSAAVWYVDDSSPGPIYDGTSWATAFLTVQEGIDAASAGEQVWVAEGTYYRPIGGNEPVLAMKSGVEIYGGFAGTESELSERGDPGSHPTELDGEFASEHVVTGASDSRLDGFTIMYGAATLQGGGMHNQNLSNIIVANCVFYNNVSQSAGAGIYNDSVISSQIYKCNFLYNWADQGAGISNHNVLSTNIDGCVFKGNTAYLGVCIENDQSAPLITNSVFSNNMAASANASVGLSNIDSSPSILNCTFANNSRYCRTYYYIYQCSDVVRSTSLSDTFISNSILWNSGSEEIIGPATVTYSDVEGGFAGTGNFDASPMFVSSSDLHLQVGSPCINAGTSAGMPFFDLEGNPRPMGGYHDVGAYEMPGLVACEDGVDNDGDTLTDYPDDPDCTLPTDTDEYGSGVCNDGIDNDGDRSIDMQDQGCTDINDTSELGTNECDDGVDNDGDTLIDYPNDPGCDDNADTSEYLGTECDDGIDNDGDTLADWPDDPGCYSIADTTEHSGYQCDDGVDNDGDTLIDWPADPGCTGLTDWTERMGTACDDGKDNDNDTFTDYPSDPGCTSLSDTSEYGVTECDDGLDNDNDSLFDYPDDPGCTDPLDDDELGVTACDDGIDNDGDTKTDWPHDYDCYSPLDDTETSGTVWYVNLNATGAGNGTSWANAFTNIQPAVDIAAADDMVWVAGGTYYSPLGGNNPVLIMKDGVMIFGGFLGTESALSQRVNPQAYPTILHGQWSAFHVVFGASGARLDGFTIVGGDAPDNGGGMYNSNISNLLVTNCIFKNNEADDGGAMFNSLSSIVISNSVFMQNSGGIYNTSGIQNNNSSSTISSCTFARNENMFYCGIIVGGDCYYVGYPPYLMCYDIWDWVPCDPSLSNDSLSSSEIYNSIFWNPSIFEITGPASVSYSNVEGGFDGIGNIDSDPMFVSYLDLHLQSGSPCINSGTLTGAPPYDIQGIPRPVGLGVDMGAFEYAGPQCSDTFDNDGDTYIDYPEDPGCSSPTDNSETNTTECNDGIDNDGDTHIDYPADPGCSSSTDNSEIDVTECSDGIDNDGDTLIDWPNDPGCVNLSDMSEIDETIQLDFNPGSGTVTATGPFVEVLNVVWNGTNTFDFDLKLNWTDPGFHIENSSLRVTAADSTALNAIIVNQDIGVGAIGDNLPGVNPGIVYVADTMVDGPETFTVCDPDNPTDCTTSPYTFINAECGSVTAHWTMTESSGWQYTFWLDLFNDAYPTSLTSDPRYDPGTASIYLRTFEVNGFNEGAQTTTVSPGQWFYVHYYLDYPGNNRALPFDTRTVEGPKRIEDTGNIAAWNNGNDPYADYWYLGRVNSWSIRFDPAVIEVNSTYGTVDPPGDGSFIFMTAPTDSPPSAKLRMLRDPNLFTDGVDFSSVTNQVGITASNMMGVWKQAPSTHFEAMTSWYPNPCGRYDLNKYACNAGHGTDSYDTIDWDIGFLPLHAKSGLPSGIGSAINISFDSNTTFTAYRTNGLVYWSPYHTAAEVPRSANWPEWCTRLPGGTCESGQYNAERAYICVQ